MKKIEGLYVTHASQKEAQKIIDLLVRDKYIACANVFPIRSFYIWNEAVQDDDEVVSLLKTNARNVEKCIKKVEELHPYDTPCILHYSLQANKAYADWIDECTL